jgi:hypothetical protein
MKFLLAGIDRLKILRLTFFLKEVRGEEEKTTGPQ